MNTNELTSHTNYANQDVGDLVQSIRDGETAAYEVIISRFERMAFHHALTILNNPQDAQDAVQEAFWEAFQSLSKLRTNSAFPGWFRRIVLKQADRQLRSRVKGVGKHSVPLTEHKTAVSSYFLAGDHPIIYFTTVQN